MVSCASCLEHNRSAWFPKAFLGAFERKMKVGIVNMSAFFFPVATQNELALTHRQSRITPDLFFFADFIEQDVQKLTSKAAKPSVFGKSRS